MKTYGPREKRQARRNGSLARRVRMGGTVVRSAIFSVATAVLFGGPPAWAAEPVGAVVDLGPGTRAQLNRPSLKRVDRPALYLLSGWLKLRAGKLPAATKGSFASPQFDALGAVGEVVARVEDSSSKVFAEDGPLQILKRRAGAQAPITIKSGDFISLNKDDALKVEVRPTHEFIAALPRQFEDPLPARLAQFRAREVPARPS